jgi:ABC-2 type transport system ATP-binding protein
MAAPAATYNLIPSDGKAMSAVIELDKLGVRLAGRQILSDLSVSISGRSIGLLGPNGAGKTTLLHTLLGFHKASTGTARVFGMDIDTEAKALREITGYMPENESFIAGISAVKFVRLMAELSGIPSWAALERAHEALYYVGLGEARYRNLETYSLGMKQRVKLAQAIVHAPKLIILDEPTNGLDPPARLRMIKLIREIRESGKVHLILSSHLLRDVEECCDEVLVLKQGKIAAYCNLEEEHKANKRFIELEAHGGSDKMAEALGDRGIEWASSGRDRIKLVLPETLRIHDLFRIADERGIQIRRLDHKRDSLQDIFMKAMEGESVGGL